MEKQNTNLILISMVAVVAIIGIIVLITSTGTRNLQSGEDSAGQVARALRVTDGTSSGILSVSQCKDSDINIQYPDGINPTIKGITSFGKMSKSDFCRNYNSSTLVEYYCSKNKVVSTDINCADKGFNCVDGACQAQALPTCGDGIITPPEECEYEQTISCSQLGNFTNGTATCTNDCTWNLNQCQAKPIANIVAIGGTLYYYGGSEQIEINPYAGDQVTAKVTIYNSGTTPINLQTFSVKLTHSNTGQNQVNWCQPTTTWLQPERYGQCTTYQYGAFTLVAGINTFIFDVDYYNQLPESDENDNTYEYVVYAVPNGTGNLYVVSTPSNANIYVDNVYKNVTPKTITGLSIGNHVVKLTKPGYYDYTATKTIYGGQTTNMTVTLILNQSNQTATSDLIV